MQTYTNYVTQERTLLGYIIGWECGVEFYFYSWWGPPCTSPYSSLALSICFWWAGLDLLVGENLLIFGPHILCGTWVGLYPIQQVENASDKDVCVWSRSIRWVQFPHASFGNHLHQFVLDILRIRICFKLFRTHQVSVSVFAVLLSLMSLLSALWYLNMIFIHKTN